MAIATIHIRPARQQDIDQMVLLLKSLFALEKDFTFDPARHADGLQLLLGSERSMVLVAEYEGRIAGMCSGQQVISTVEGGPALLVEDVVVAAQLRGQGIGRRLLRTLTEWAKTRGISRMQLLADSDNSNALAFYKHSGWQTTRLICLRKLTSDKQ